MGERIASFAKVIITGIIHSSVEKEADSISCSRFSHLMTAFLFLFVMLFSERLGLNKK